MIHHRIQIVLLTVGLTAVNWQLCPADDVPPTQQGETSVRHGRRAAAAAALGR